MASLFFCWFASYWLLVSGFLLSLCLRHELSFVQALFLRETVHA